MKKFTLLVLSASALLACSGNDDTTDTVSLTGTWKLASATLPEPYDFNNDGVASTDFMAETGCLGNSTITFTDDVASAIVNMQSLEIRQQSNGSYTVACHDAITENAPFTVTQKLVTLTSVSFNAPFSKDRSRLVTTINGTTAIFVKQ